MKKTGRAMMGSMLFAAMLLGSSAAAEAKTYRVLTNYADSNKTHMIFDTIVKQYQEEVDPDFDVEWETIFYKGIMPNEKVLDLPVDCNTLTGSVNL